MTMMWTTTTGTGTHPGSRRRPVLGDHGTRRVRPRPGWGQGRCSSRAVAEANHGTERSGHEEEEDEEDEEDEATEKSASTCAVMSENLARVSRWRRSRRRISSRSSLGGLQYSSTAGVMGLIKKSLSSDGMRERAT